MGADAVARDAAGGVREPTVASLQTLTPTTPTRIDPVPILDRLAEKREYQGVPLASRLLALLIVGLLVGLPAVAFADPPDPTWIGGFWDDDDFDSAVIAIGSACAIGAPSVCGAAPQWACLARVELAEPAFIFAYPRPAAAPRSPPIA